MNHTSHPNRGGIEFLKKEIALVLWWSRIYP
jgi:hypothetical protein